MFKSAFVSLYLVMIVALTGHAAFALSRGGDPFAWAGVLLTTAPFLVILSWIMATRAVARTSARLPGVTVLAALGLALTLWSAIYRGAGMEAPVLAALGLAGFLLYAYWYSSLGPRSSQIVIGKPLASITLRNALGVEISSDDWRGRPSILIFFRGNWCPLCMAQIKELAGRYREIEALGVRTALISPQPHENTAALARTHNVNFEFYTDTDNVAARALGIDHPGGLPLGMQAMGYDGDTVLPTVIITDVRGLVIWAHETDNYRVRPEPDVYLEVLRQRAGLIPAQ